MPSDADAIEDTRRSECDAMPADRRLALAWQLFTSLEFQVQVADRKVHAIFGANTLMVAALSLYGHSTLAELTAGGLTALEIVGILGRLLLLGFACGSVVFAILALMPRVLTATPPAVQLSAPSSGRSPFFFGDIARMDEREYVAEFSGLSAEAAADQLLVQVRLVSQVVSAKYHWARRSALCLVVSLGLWMLVLGVRFLG